MANEVKNKKSVKEKLYLEVMEIVDDPRMIVSPEEAYKKGSNIINQGYIETNSQPTEYYKYDLEYIDKNYLDIDILLKVKTLHYIRKIRFWITFWSISLIIIGLIYGYNLLATLSTINRFFR